MENGENMDVTDVSVEKRLSREGECASVPEAERSVRAMIELVYPLVRNGRSVATVDIAEEIILPTEHSGWRERAELEKLCAVFSVVLEQLGNTILTTLAIYLATLDAENTLEHFIDAMGRIAAALPKAYDTSLIEAFHIGLLNGFADESF